MQQHLTPKPFTLNIEPLIQDAKVVYSAVKANNPLADVVLAYARTEYEQLDRELVYLQATRARSCLLSAG